MTATGITTSVPRTLAATAGLVAVCGLLIALTHQLTQPAIAAQREAHAQRILQDLLQGAALTDTCDGVMLRNITVAGYGGDIEFVTARFANATLNMRTLRHNETPGIGDFIDQTRAPWIRTLDGVNAESMHQLDGVSGATITSQAVQRALREAFAAAESACG